MTAPMTLPKATRREWMGLAVLALPCLLYSMDLTVLNLAVPSLSAQLRPSGIQLLWIIDIYGFVLAGALITMGTLGDRIGRRRLLLIGAAAFGVASILAAFSRSASMLIAARAVLGLAGATLAPSTLSLIRSMFHHPAQRTVAVGVWVSSYSGGAAVGPLLGGFLLERFWWGSVFLLGAPVMALLLLLGPRLLPEHRDPNPDRLDLAGAALSLLATLLVIYGLKQFAAGGPSWPPAFFVAMGLGAGILFVRRQRSHPGALVEPALFRNRAFSGSLATYALGTFVAFGVYVFLSQYLQLVLGMSPLRAGLWMTPLAAGFIAGSLLTPALARRFRAGALIAGGLAVAAVGFAALAQLGLDSGPGWLVVGVLVYSLGLAPAFTLSTDLVIGSAPPERAGAAAALSETGSELGGALGIAILGTIGTGAYRSSMAHAGSTAAARETLAAALEVAKALPWPAGDGLAAAAREAFASSLRLACGTAAIIALCLALLAALALRRAGATPSAGDRPRR